MLTERINYRYVKLVADIIGIFASIGILTIIAFNFYLNIESNGSSEVGFKVTGSSMVTLNILIMIAIAATIISFILKRKRMKSI
ncbi:hypothetical protein BUY89_13840 [Staphylococcus equorum]|uniref:hypothetical protein n=1 Tax=Staphylococcus equorum TaxID=246432 RepID=UPI000D1CB25D|nr:hypothetical protein [Staphylococcus equorum]PTE80370.1 hypothetical protein BUY85_06220 [Staphylococcus equorum]PTE89856.1 hypothetical protein BUY89_13840 [Staphylococcus equorum]RIL38269.1 hypothetical protein BUY84_09325 [Staphylococcus equorum]